jgi:beta-glucosidase
MSKLINAILVAGLSTLVVACSAPNTDKKTKVSSLDIWPSIDSAVKKDPAIELKVKALVESMTLEQKIAQMMQPEIKDITVEDMRKYGFGSYLNGGGSFPNGNKYSTPQDWIDYAQLMYDASMDDSIDGIAIPTLWGTDAVHGHNNVIGATLFPHNIGLGATNNPELIKKIAQATATEVMVTGIDWVFAPTVATVRDDRWGRTYEGYSEDPEIIKTYASAIVEGLQGKYDEDFLGDNRVISTVKHFIGDGGTDNGADQGNNTLDEQTLFDIHAQGYVGGLTAGAQTVMASFNRWQGNKLHGSEYLLNQVLKQKMGFDGFVVGDWNGHGQVKGCTNESCPAAINAGLDVFMAPTHTWKPLFYNTIKQVKDGTIAMSRIDDAVTRILRVKYRAGLFSKPSPANRKFSGKVEYIGHEKHRDIAKQAVKESLVLLKNNNNILPLSPKLNVLMIGDGADNIGKQSGGWSISWQGNNNTNQDFPGGTSIYDGINKLVTAAGGIVTLSANGEFDEAPDVVIAVYGEEPYAEGQGDVKDLAYKGNDTKELSMLNRMQAQGIPVVSVFISGRPLWVNPQLNASDAFIAAWLPGSEGSAVAEVLFSQNDQTDFKGKLSFSWPNTAMQHVNRFDKDVKPLFPYGYGLTYSDKLLVNNNLSEEYVTTEAQAATDVVMFNQKIILPWQLQLRSNKALKDVLSNSVVLDGIGYRTIDKHVQEDAFKFTTDGKKLGGIVVTTQDNLMYSSENLPQLQLTLKHDKSSPASLILALNCDNENTCESTKEVGKLFASSALEGWTTVGINASCFSNGGQDGLNLRSLSLLSSDLINISISDMRLSTRNITEHQIDCN